MKNEVYELNDSELRMVVGGGNGENSGEMPSLGTPASVSTDTPLCPSCGSQLGADVLTESNPFAASDWQVYSCRNSLCPCRFRKHTNGTWDWYLTKNS